MVDELTAIFRRNFPYIVRGDKKVLEILSGPENKIFEKRNKNNELIGVSVVHKNTIYLLCVDAEYRNRGGASELLTLSEDCILSNGYDRVIAGAGGDYIMPGVPVRSKPYNEVLHDDAIDPSVNDDAGKFFESRGYSHSWTGCNCFDMRVNLKDFTYDEHSIGGVINGVTYRWAAECDIPRIKLCTDDAFEGFTQYYLDKKIYDPSNNQRVLIAEKRQDVCGVLIIGVETEGEGLGSVGCTAVSHRYRGNFIAANMVILGTKYLKDMGLQSGYLGYTYSGLDKLYGFAGYKICLYYNMAEKKF
jgi:ribosomal protein S18 acetylase RimI-like enzyme